MANKKSNSTSKTTAKKSNSNSKSYYKKQVKKEVKKFAKKNPKTFLIILLIVLLLAGAGVAVYFLLIKNKANDDDHNHNTPAYVQEGISINFLELGSWHTGDCTFIKAGEADILIDAGSESTSIPVVKNFINQYCSDGKLEYVIVTHAHDDHYSCFFDADDKVGIFNSYKIGTLIDFPKTNKTPTSTNTLGKYINARDARIASGDIEHHYTALECCNEKNGAQKTYTINEGITMDILYQKYYETDFSGTENNYSVCTLFNHGSNHYLFTGDLQSGGESSLVDENPSLPHCQLFKGGHHGSGTSNTNKLLNVITPETVCICCCAGNDEFTSNPDNQFPYQEVVNRIALHTDQIYVTSVTTDGHTGYTSMNGNITFKCENGVDYTVTGSNNSLKLKETEWFKANRTWPTGGK